MNYRLNLIIVHISDLSLQIVRVSTQTKDNILAMNNNSTQVLIVLTTWIKSDFYGEWNALWSVDDLDIVSLVIN